MRFVAAGSLDTVIRIWDLTTGDLVERLRGHRDCVYGVAFTPDGKGLVSGSLDKTLKFWDVGGLYLSNAKRAAGGNGVMDPVPPGQVAIGKKSPCTMNFTGHKVPPTFLFFPLHQGK